MNRREFLGLAGATASGLLLPGRQVRGRLTKPGELVRIGVIGTGARGTGLMLVLKALGGARVVACADLLPKRLERAVSIAGEGCRGHHASQRVLDDPEVDAVIVATPLSLHHEMASSAIEAGKHVYCEKTMTYQIAEALDLVGRAEASARVFQVGYQYRYHPLYLRVAEMVRSGYLGKVTNVYAQWNRNGDWRRPVDDPKNERLINWRMYHEYSGGLLAELSSHQLDFVNWIFDAHPQRFVGFGGIDTWQDGRETFDNVNVVLDYESGMTVNCVCLTANAHDGYQVELRGSKGTIEVGTRSAFLHSEALSSPERGLVDGVTGATRTRWQRSEGVPIEVEGLRAGWEGTHYALDSFLRAITDDAPVDSDVRRGARSAISTRLAIDAVRQGRPQQWSRDYDVATKQTGDASAALRRSVG